MAYQQSKVDGVITRIDDELCLLTTANDKRFIVFYEDEPSFGLLKDQSALEANNIRVRGKGIAVWIDPKGWKGTLFEDDVPLHMRPSIQGLIKPGSLELTEVDKYDFGVDVSPGKGGGYEAVDPEAMSDTEYEEWSKSRPDRLVGKKRKANHRKEADPVDDTPIDVPILAVDGNATREGDGISEETRRLMYKNWRYGAENLPPEERITDARVEAVYPAPGDGQDSQRFGELVVEYEDRVAPYFRDDGTIDVEGFLAANPDYRDPVTGLPVIDLSRLSPDKMGALIDELSDIIDGKLADAANQITSQLHKDIGWLVELGESLVIRDRYKAFRVTSVGMLSALCLSVTWLNIGRPVFSLLADGDRDNNTLAEHEPGSPGGWFSERLGDVVGNIFNGDRISGAGQMGKQLVLPDGGVCTVTSLMGPRNIGVGSTDHKGIDFGCSGSPARLDFGHDNDIQGRRHYLYVPGDAVLTARFPNQTGGGGLVARLEFRNGKTLQVLHMHSIIAPDGPVKRGTLLGIGSAASGTPEAGTGTGPHDHFEVYSVDGGKRQYEPMTWNMAQALYGARGIGQRR